MNRQNQVGEPSDSPRKLLLKGLLFLLAGLLLIGLVLQEIGRANAGIGQAEHLHPLSVAALQDTPPGRTVLLEGQISNRTPTRFRSFVAYVREEEPGEDWARGWKLKERVMAPLWIELADGQVHVVNSDYQLDRSILPLQWQPELSRLQALIKVRSERYRGLAIGSSVVVIGRTMRRSEGMVIAADVVASGRQADYIERQRAVTISYNDMAFGLLLNLIGACLLLAAIQRMWRARRRASLPL